MTRRRTAAGLTALAAITGALVFGGVTAANADAGLEITTTTVDYGGFSINGTFDDANGSNTIELRLGTLAEPGGIICGSATQIPGGTWVCNTSMDPGVYTVTARQLGSPGVDRSDTANITVVPPLPDYDNGDPVVITAGDLPSFGGDVTAPNGDMTVSIAGIGTCSTGAYPGPGYTWSCEVAEVADAAPGDYALSVTQTSNGVTSAAVTATLRINPGPITITSPADGSAIPWTGVPTSISGTVLDPGEGDVQLYYLGEADLCTATPSASGAWSCNSPGALALGSYPISATQNVGPGPFVGSQFDVVVPTPNVTSDNPMLVPYGGSSTIGGTVAYPSGIVEVTVPSLPGVGCSFVIDAAGPWECLIALDAEPAGTYTVEIVHTVMGATSAAPATVELRIGQAAPANPVIDSPLDGAVLTSGGGNWLTVTGQAPLGYPVSLYSYYDDFPQCVNLTVDYNATWTCSIDLPSGVGYLYAYQDQDGSGSLSPTITVTVQEPSGSTAPTLNCTFSPNGGFTASSPQQMATFQLSRVYTNDGKGDGNSFGAQGNCGGSTGSPFPSYDSGLDFVQISECEPSCAASGLAPGIYEVYYTRSEFDQTPGLSFEPHSYVFTIPEAPAITTVASTVNSVVLSGTATAGDGVRIVGGNGANLCTTTASTGGTWACQFPKSNASSARAISINQPSGGMSAYSASRSIPVFVAPVLPTLPVEPPVTLETWFLEFGGDLSNLKPGDKFTLSVSGMPVGTEIEIWMHSDPVLLGTATGTGLPMALNLQVPKDIASGAHEIKMIAVTPLGTNYFYTSDATVLGGASPEKPLDTIEDPKGLDDTAGSGGNGGSSADRDDPGAPSGISGTIAPLQAILDNPGAIAVAGGLALALLFLVALPTELLNSSLSSNTSRLGRVYGAIDSAMTRAQNWLIKKTHSRALVAIILVALVAVIYGFVDPGFGFDIVSLRLVLSLAIAFFLLSFVASWVSGIIIRRAWGAMAIVALQPSIILFAVVGVIVARILDFSPGFLVGVAIGLELLQASKHVAARAVFVQIAVVTGFALAAWVVYSLFTPGNDFVGMLLEDTMVATTAEGLTGALIAVFPLKFLDGRELWEVSKRLWAAAFLIVGTAFALLVLPTAISGTNVADIVAWLIVFAVFGGVSFGVWLIFVRADKRASAAEKERIDA